MTTSSLEKHTFQAEVKQVLDIVVHSLYTDKEIFIRELVSNASDALEKLRHLQITEKEVLDENLPLEIHLSTDEVGGTITIQDFGIGMTKEELIENLGTIAHSGSKAFLKALQEQGSEKNENLIGQFGVGFYSAFMVADRVRVFTRHWRSSEELGYCWSSDGSDYTIEPSEGERRGTKVVIQLKEEYKEFAKASRAKTILERYSAFVPFPIHCNGKKLNTVQALWLQNKNEITEEQYLEFYKYQSKAFDEPFFRLHFSSDVPLMINALLFVPGDNLERFDFSRMGPFVSLYSRKVLIDAEPKGLLPEWLRFLKGVVDSPDLPLNISRETMQDSALLQKLNRVLTKRFLKELEKMAEKEPAKYTEFWTKFGIFLKEGITSDFTHREALEKLLRYESSFTQKEELVSFTQYVDRMKPEQKEIYFLVGANRESIEAGPYLEAFKARSIEVLYLFESIDDFVMTHLGSFRDKKLISIDQEDIQLEEIPTAEEQPVQEDELKNLCEWIKEKLGEQKVTNVTIGNRLVNSPAIILNSDKMMSSHMHRIMKAMHKGPELPSRDLILQINASHPLIKNLVTLKDKNEELSTLAVEQIYDNARMAAGLLEDPKEMIKRIYTLLETVTQDS